MSTPFELPPTNDRPENIYFNGNVVSWEFEVDGHRATRGFLQPNKLLQFPVSEGGDLITIINNGDKAGLFIEELTGNGQTETLHVMEEDGRSVLIPEGKTVLVNTTNTAGKIVEYVCEYPGQAPVKKPEGYYNLSAAKQKLVDIVDAHVELPGDDDPAAKFAEVEKVIDIEHPIYSSVKVGSYYVDFGGAAGGIKQNRYIDFRVNALSGDDTPQSILRIGLWPDGHGSIRNEEFALVGTFGEYEAEDVREDFVLSQLEAIESQLV